MTRRVLAATPTVVVTTAFGHYVLAMTEQWPSDAEAVAWPTVEEPRWPLPDRPALFDLEEPVSLGFFITNEGLGEDNHPVEHYEDRQEVVAMFVIPPRLTPKPDEVYPYGRSAKELVPRGQPGWVVHIHSGWLSAGYWIWGGAITRHPGQEHFGHVARFDRALVEAIGHRLSVLSEPTGTNRSDSTSGRLPRHPSFEQRTCHRNLMSCGSDSTVQTPMLLKSSIGVLRRLQLCRAIWLESCCAVTAPHTTNIAARTFGQKITDRPSVALVRWY
jgi:hypothetical protein